MRQRQYSDDVSSLMAAILVGVLLLFAGCGGGGDGIQRFDVSGKVTFNGAPVPAGQIVFEPDSLGGNKGPPGLATITNGAFDTAKNGKGTVGGPHIVRITGQSGPPGSAGVKQLFREYQTKANFEKKSATTNFDVPASAAEGLVNTNEPPP